MNSHSITLLLAFVLSLSFGVQTSGQISQKDQIGSPKESNEYRLNTSLKSNVDYINSIGLEFIAVPAGAFLMGATENDSESFGNAKPAHIVRLSKPFYLGKFEVTQAQWEKVMGENPYKTERNNGYGNYLNENFIDPQNPVTVSWTDAREFITKLNSLEGTNAYRLPTEAEWEYTARAGTSSIYFFGEDKAKLNDYAWHSLQFISGSHQKVGQKQPNPWGFHDIYGNVWEWVADGYGIYTQDEQKDPLLFPDNSVKVVRGGSWHITSNGWHSSMRKGYEKDYRGISIGFRVAMSQE